MNLLDPGPAKIHDFGRHFHVSGGVLYQELLVCYIQIFYVLLKFNFVRVSASVLLQTFIFNSVVCSPKY